MNILPMLLMTLGPEIIKGLMGSGQQEEKVGRSARPNPDKGSRSLTDWQGVGSNIASQMRTAGKPKTTTSTGTSTMPIYDEPRDFSQMAFLLSMILGQQNQAPTETSLMPTALGIPGLSRPGAGAALDPSRLLGAPAPAAGGFQVPNFNLPSPAASGAINMPGVSSLTPEQIYALWNDPGR